MKHYLVVGASSGIGLALTQKLADAGSRVTAFSRERRELIESETVAFHPVDITGSPEDFPILKSEIHGMVYCPGTIQLRPFKALKSGDYLHDFEVNVLGAVKIINTYFKQFQEGASIVLFSTVAVQTGMAFHASVAASKGAVEGLTRSLAAEFAPKIRVNAIAPSVTSTPLANKLLNTEAKETAARERHPLRRFGQPEDVAAAAAFLLGSESSWVTGQVISVDGGLGSLRLL